MQSTDTSYQMLRMTSFVFTLTVPEVEPWEMSTKIVAMSNSMGAA